MSDGVAANGDRADVEIPGLQSGVEITGLHKSFGHHPVLSGVDLSVPPGSITAILGPSGSGKTTLLRILAGFARPDRGTITVGSRQVDGPGRHISPSAWGVGYVPQEGCLFPHLDVRANVGFGLPRSSRRRRVAELLESTGLTGLAARFPHQLSGGQQQRVALARALAPRPSLVLLDEPFSSLDAALRTSVRVDVVELLKDAEVTCVIVTHDQDEALSMADQVAVLRHGRIAQAARPLDLYTHPSDAEVARFVGDANLIDGVVRAGQVDTVFGALPCGPVAGAVDGTRMTVMVRPEQIEVVAGPTGDTLEGVVGDWEFHGHDAIFNVVPSDPAFPARLSVRCIGSARLAPGTTVALRATGPVVAWPQPVGC
jgi:iron(III) transport system ATP-binding protein